MQVLSCNGGKDVEQTLQRGMDHAAAVMLATNMRTLLNTKQRSDRFSKLSSVCRHSVRYFLKYLTLRFLKDVFFFVMFNNPVIT